MMRLVVLAGLMATLVAGCGTGAEGGGAMVQETPVTLRVSLRGPSASTVVYAAELVLRLPSGIRVASDAATGAVPADRLQAADPDGLAAARYIPASGSDAPRLKLEVADPHGFAVGPLANIACQASGTVPDAARFEVESFSAKDENGATLSRITPELAVSAP